MRTRMCSRCAAVFERTRRDPSVWCLECRGATSDQELTAILYPDRSGIHSLHEHIRDAFDAMRADAAVYPGLHLVKVIGHAGAVGQVERYDDEDEADRRYDDRHYEASQ